MSPARHERAAALLEGLLADPQLRAAFHRSPGSTCRGFDLPELAIDLQTGASGTLPLERRESRSSLAGAMVAAAAEGISLVELAFDRASQHGPADRTDRLAEGRGGARTSQGGPAGGADRLAQGRGGARTSQGGPRLAEGRGSSQASGAARADASPRPSARPASTDPERSIDARPDERTGAVEPIAHSRGPAAYPGAGASPQQIASWMARRAADAGLPEELPVMAALAQSGLSDPPPRGQHTAGFFRMSREEWDRSLYKGFAEDPDLQLAWFLDRAAVVRAERVAAGDGAYGQDPSSWHDWIGAAVERPAAHPAGDGGRLAAAQRLLEEARPRPDMAAQSATAAPAERAVQIAQRYLGQPYRWGGAAPATGFDCSGLVQYAYGQAGVTLPRVTHEQFVVGDPVGREELRTGDIVFFRDASGYIHHEGIYLGDGEFLHAPRTGDVIKVSSLEESYYAQQFAGGRRVDQLAQGDRPARG